MTGCRPWAKCLEWRIWSRKWQNLTNHKTGHKKIPSPTHSYLFKVTTSGRENKTVSLKRFGSVRTQQGHVRKGGALTKRVQLVQKSRLELFPLEAVGTSRRGIRRHGHVPVSGAIEQQRFELFFFHSLFPGFENVCVFLKDSMRKLRASELRQWSVCMFVQNKKNRNNPTQPNWGWLNSATGGRRSTNKRTHQQLDDGGRAFDYHGEHTQQLRREKIGNEKKIS